MSRLIAAEDKCRPREPGNMQRRWRLLRALRSGDRAVPVLLNAGAGFGKSTLLAQLYTAFRGKKFWYRFDVEDRYPGLFLLTMTADLCRNPQERASCALAVHEAINHAPSISILVDLVNDLASRTNGQAALFFDDFHFVEKDFFVNEVVKILLERLPDNFRIYIAARARPDLGLSRLRAQRRLNQVGAGALCFSWDETRAFLAAGKKPRLTIKEIDTWHSLTQGWPVALACVREEIERGSRPPAMILPRLLGKGGKMHELIEEEIMSAFDSSVRETLEACSLTDLVNADLCDSVLSGQGDLRKALHRLEEAEMAAYDDMAGAYRFHPFLSEFLRQSLTGTKNAGEIAQLQTLFNGAVIGCREKPTGACPDYADRGSGREAHRREACMDLLTSRERQVYSLLASGKANLEIAAQLGIRESTVKKHVSNIFQKLEIKHRSQVRQFFD